MPPAAKSHAESSAPRPRQAVDAAFARRLLRLARVAQPMRHHGAEPRGLEGGGGSAARPAHQPGRTRRVVGPAAEPRPPSALDRKRILGALVQKRLGRAHRDYRDLVLRAVRGKRVVGLTLTPDLRYHALRFADGTVLQITLDSVSVCGVRTPEHDHVVLMSEASFT